MSPYPLDVEKCLFLIKTKLIIKIKACAYISVIKLV